jgi:hypothetical protein
VFLYSLSNPQSCMKLSVSAVVKLAPGAAALRRAVAGAAKIPSQVVSYEERSGAESQLLSSSWNEVASSVQERRRKRRIGKKETYGVVAACSIVDDERRRRVLHPLPAVETGRPVSRRINHPLRAVRPRERRVQRLIPQVVVLASEIELGGSVGREVVRSEGVDIGRDEGEGRVEGSGLLQLGNGGFDLLACVGSRKALAVTLKDVDLSEER